MIAVGRYRWVPSLALLLALTIPPLSAQAPSDAEQQWQMLNAQTVEAYQAGDYARGVIVAEQALQLARLSLGIQNPKMATSLNNLALLYCKEGRYGEAEPLYQEALQTYREVFGPRHPDMLQGLNNLAELYRAQGRYAEAEPLYKEALQGSREALGPHHSVTLQSLNNLAALYYSQGRYGEAEPLFKEALQAQREELGPQHPRTLASINNLALLYKTESRYGEAEPLFKEALQTQREVLGPRHPDTLASLNNLALLYQAEDRYGEAEPRLKEALQGYREVFGPRHPNTLQGLNNLGMLYEAQGRFGEAEPLINEALQGEREVLGPRHPDTLATLNNLAVLYGHQGRYGEMEQRLKDALQDERAALGPGHSNTLTSLNNLAELYEAEGRYGEAESLFKEALQGKREVFGPRHPDTLTSLNNLAALYRAQRRYVEAESLYKEALEGYHEALGPRHSGTLTTLNNLGALYRDQGRYGLAELFDQEALQGRREVLGPRHPDTLKSLNNLADLYRSQGRYGEAEPLYQEALQGDREVLGPRHPDTLVSLNNLAGVYYALGRYGEAEPLYQEALRSRRETIGPRHPDTLVSELDFVFLLVSQHRHSEAINALREMDANLLGRVDQELYATEAGTVRRQLVSSQATFQDVVLTLGLAERSSDAVGLAGNVLLRWKWLQGEEEAAIAHLARHSQDAKVRALAKELTELRGELSAASRSDKPGVFEAALQAYEAKQLALAQANHGYDERLRVAAATVDDLQNALPPDAVLIEFRQFRPVDFKTGKSGEPRLAGMLFGASAPPVLADLGPAADVRAENAALIRQTSPMETAKSASGLYQRLLAPFESSLAASKTVYIAPDGPLHLVPFSRLKHPDGRYLVEKLDVHVVQTGRDLLRVDPDRPGRGLLALGGIDFGGTAPRAAQGSVMLAAVGSSDRSDAATRAAGLLGDFSPLSHSGDEVSKIKSLYQEYRHDEPADVWTGMNASKVRLLALTSPPRVLHLATHGFFLPGPSPEPMLLAGVALAGANKAPTPGSNDGILFALDAQGLDLDGTELVVLSACDTARGSLDYSEGVFGLARALRIAGARDVLVTLWPVNDDEAHNFMIDFYQRWLKQTGRSDPAQALRDTRLSYISQSSEPLMWAPYVLVE